MNLLTEVQFANQTFESGWWLISHEFNRGMTLDKLSSIESPILKPC